MKKVLKVIAKLIFTYALCGGLYVMLELAWRGRSDISMLLLSGFLGLFAMFFNNIFSYETDYIIQVLSVSIIATKGYIGKHIANKNKYQTRKKEQSRSFALIDLVNQVITR